MDLNQKQTSAAQHAAAIYALAAGLGEALAANLADGVAMTGSPLNDPKLDREALAGIFQYGLVFCALEKCALNRPVDEEYWTAVGQALEFMARKGARAAADAILMPLRGVAQADELRAIATETHDPLRAYDGVSLQRLDQGPDHTPIGVLTKQIVPLFYARADHDAVAQRIVDISFQGVKILFTDGGLV